MPKYSHNSLLSYRCQTESRYGHEQNFKCHDLLYFSNYCYYLNLLVENLLVTEEYRRYLQIIQYYSFLFLMELCRLYDQIMY